MIDPDRHKVIITGGGGQLGRCLQRSAPPNLAVISVSRSELDISDAAAVRELIQRSAPNVVINAAAYTAVDKAESEEAIAYEVNCSAVATLAKAAEEVGAKFVNISTDFVFDGRDSAPYRPNSPTNPINAYGRTKLAGEKAAGESALVIRTSWVHSAFGSNFVRTMLRLMRERNEIRVVTDQVGSPTYAGDLAEAVWKLTSAGETGMHHFTNAGVASWYDFAVAIYEEAQLTGLLRDQVSIVPIRSEDFPTPALRPQYSVLDKEATFQALGGASPHWRDGVRRVITELMNG